MFTERLVQTVIGKSHDSVEARTLTILANAQEEKPYPELQQLCLSTAGSYTHGWESVRMIVAAGVAFSPAQAHEWLETLVEPFGFADPKTEPDKCPNYWLGVTLGLFEAVVWHDQQWHLHTEFETLLPDTIVQIVTAKTDFTGDGKQSAGASGYVSEIAIDWQSWESKLSTAVKAYVRGADHNRGRRLADVRKIIQESTPRICNVKALEQDGLNLPIQNQIVINQICYAMFGEHLIYFTRLRMLDGFFDDLLGMFTKTSAA